MFTGKVVLVTGASSGIGKAIALKMAEQKATVIVNYMHSKAGADAVVEEIMQMGGIAEAIPCSVHDYNAVENMIANIIKKYGHIDVLVNNAGITKDNLLLMMKEADFDDVININLKGTFNTMRHVSRQMMKQKGGSIVNISSIVGVMGNAGQVNYAASKAGIIGMTKSMAKELGSRNIRVNAVAPGFVETAMTDVLSEEVKEAAKAQTSLKRFAKPEEIASAVCFLASEHASYITGHVLHVDGGM